MNIHVIGLGKMGLGLAKNLKLNGYQVVGFDLNEETREEAKKSISLVESSINAMTNHKDGLNVVLLSIPSGKAIDDTLDEIINNYDSESIIVDCGNSNYKDTIRRYEYLKTKGFSYLDCGVSGGPSGALNGACTMIGGDRSVYMRVKKVFDDISVDGGSLYIGKSGSGHFVKMIHNGIEYGMMQAIAEGYEIIHESEFDVDLSSLSKLYNNGSVIRSWLIELMAEVMSEDQDLNGLKGVMNSSGEAKWTVETALDLEIPAPVISLSLMMRNRSLKENTYSGRVVAALRNKFGGHSVEK